MQRSELEEQGQELTQTKNAVELTRGELSNLKSTLGEVVTLARMEAQRENLQQRLKNVESELQEIEGLKNEYDIQDSELLLSSEARNKIDKYVKQFIPSSRRDLPRIFMLQIA